MKQFKVLVALVLALALTMSVCSALAGSITITAPDNTPDDAKNTYRLYKVFDAVGTAPTYSYKLTANHDDVPAGFILDNGGNVYFADEVTAGTEGAFTVMVGGTAKSIKNKTTLGTSDIAAIQSYVVDADLVETIEVTGNESAVFDELADGYYFVDTTVGTLVVIDAIQPDKTVQDKNEVPPITKVISDANSVDDDGKKAIAQVGTDVEFTVTITKKKGAENYEMHDTMGAGLKYNKDVVITVDGTAVDSDKYNKTETDSSLVVLFDNDYIASLDDNTVITFVYSALVTEDALHTDPVKNTAWLEYGHNPGDNKTPVQETETYNAKFSVVKKDGAGEALPGAGFVLKDKTSGKYYKYTAATTEPAAPEKVEWVDSINEATEYTSQATTGALDGEFTGLPNGTYVLVEKTVPDGYNKAADYEFTVEGKNFTAANLIQDTVVVNNQGTTLPSTGGIGTTIFSVSGLLLVLGVAAILAAQPKADAE